MIRIFKVSGHSLFPLLKEGEYVFCLKSFYFNKLKISDIVIFEKEPHGLMIKQIKSIDSMGYFVEGTDPFSLDSRNFGYLTKNNIQYKVLFKF